MQRTNSILAAIIGIVAAYDTTGALLMAQDGDFAAPATVSREAKAAIEAFSQACRITVVITHGLVCVMLQQHSDNVGLPETRTHHQWRESLGRLPCIHVRTSIQQDFDCFGKSIRAGVNQWCLALGVSAVDRCAMFNQ